MFKYLLTLMLSINFCVHSAAQILDSIRVKNSTIDTLMLITQQDVEGYMVLRNIRDSAGQQQTYVNILKNVKGIMVRSPSITFNNIVQLAEKLEEHERASKKPITAADVTEYLSIRKIIGDTSGKTNDYLKIIKAAKLRVAMSRFMNGLHKEIDYETALKEAEENLRVRSLVDKVLVVKSQRKMYLLKQGVTIKSFNIGLGPNPVGQKQREGDGRTPEGIYKLDYQKWNSPTFHSFHISYPNEQDLARAKAKGFTAGSNIMIHGTSKGVKKTRDWTNGCIALNNVDMAAFMKMVFLETPVEIRK